MTWKQIEASREARLWLGQIVVPTVTLAAVTLSVPGVKEKIAEKFTNAKQSVKEKLKKK